MPKEQRKHPRSPASGNLQIRTALTGATYTVSVNNVSKGGAFICTSQLPVQGETISFEILDKYGLPLTSGAGEVVRITETTVENSTGFAIRFNNELEQAMLDYLCAVRIEETA